MVERIKAIETRYKGYRFRSRLEARWAVFFDALGIEWKYEDQGYERKETVWVSHSPGCTNGDTGWCQHCEGVYVEKVIGRYLPDFFFPHLGYPVGSLFAEVKGDPMALVKDWERMVSLHDYGGVLPGFSGSYGQHAGLMLLGDIPNPEVQGVYFHPILQHSKGLYRSWFAFVGHWIKIVRDGVLSDLCGLDSDACLDSEPDNWKIETRLLRSEYIYPSVLDAYRAARSSRFEHGENGGRAC